MMVVNISNTGGSEEQSKDEIETEKVESPAVFRARRRPRKTRKREENDESKGEGEDFNNDGDGTSQDVEMSREELFLLREAQQLRERVRMSKSQIDAKKVCNVGVSDSVGQNAPSSIDGNPGGLSNQFLAEQGGLAIEERMDKYIQNGLREKFGNTFDEETGKDKLPVVDTEVFEIPKQLQVEEGPQYDPSDGMPSAGLEEVEIPADGNEKAARQTPNASNHLNARRKASSREREEALTPGNLSSNFMYHRQKWREAIAPPAKPENSDHKKGGLSERRNSDRVDKVESRGDKQFTGKRSRHATEVAFADRWKKRWRR